MNINLEKVFINISSQIIYQDEDIVEFQLDFPFTKEMEEKYREFQQDEDDFVNCYLAIHKNKKYSTTIKLQNSPLKYHHDYIKLNDIQEEKIEEIFKFFKVYSEIQLEIYKKRELFYGSLISIIPEKI